MSETRKKFAQAAAGRSGLCAAGISLYFLVSGFNGCQDQQQNGRTYSGTGTKTLTISGRTDEPSASITIQQLRSPDRVPDNTAANWQTIKNVTGSSTGLSWNDPIPYYDWNGGQVSIAHGTAWPLGGVHRLRTVINSPSGPIALNAFDEDYDACSQSHASEGWMQIGQTCESDYPRPKVTHVVSTAKNPINGASTPPYLTRKRGNFAASNRNAGYYERIQVDIPNVVSTREIPDLNAFKSRFRFGFAGNGEVTATYYNRGDLGLGREMHCREWVDGSDNGVACYVTNYKGVTNAADPWGAFNTALEQPAINDAIARTKSLATVAMVYNAAAPKAAYPDKVSFMVFNGSGSFRADPNRSNNVLLTQAILDNKTASGGADIPTNCVTCHGGSVSVASSGAGTVSNAFFLPFDLQALRFSNSNSAFNRANQEEAFRKLNAMVLKTNVPTRIRDLVNGWYGGNVGVAGRTFDNNWVPPEWRVSGQVPSAPKLYNYVFEPYCQGCHMSQTGSFAFVRAADFVNAKAVIGASVCGNAAALNAPESAHQMPHAEMVMRNFWNSGARAHLMAALDLRGACN